MKYVLVKGSSLISSALSKNIKLVVDFALKKLDLSIKKSEQISNIEVELIELLKTINPDFSIVQRDLNYDLLNIAIQNLLDQANDAISNSRPKTKKKSQDEYEA